jgi:hypothetical protein
MPKSKRRYPPDIYMMANSQEYWAEGSQAWFDATVRADVNAGVNTREKVMLHDPELAELLHAFYGSNKIAKLKNCIY